MSGILVAGLRRATAVTRTHSPGRLVSSVARARGAGLGGDGAIAGVVTALGQPARRRVLCYERASGVFVAETWSASDGSYRFEHLNRAKRYMVIAQDHTEQHNAAVADLIEPERMP